MQHPHRALAFMSSCAVALAFAGCSSTTMHNAVQSGPAPAVQGVGIQVNGVAPNRTQTVQFNEAMDPATINSQTITVTNSAGTPAAGTVTYDSTFNVASFQPNPALQASASYTLTVTTGVASQQGVHLASAYTHPFTTRADEDKSPLTVVKVSPAANSTCVSATGLITATFNEGVDVNTLKSPNVEVTDANGKIIATQMSYDVTTATVTLTPTTTLPSGLITVSIRNVTDAAGVAINGVFSWTFTTNCSGGGSNGNMQYQAPLEGSQSGSVVVKGQVIVDTAGNTTVQVNGGTANSSFKVQFCPATDPLFYAHTPMGCFDVSTIATDPSGNGNVTFIFPKSGNWAGDFVLLDSNGKLVYATGLTNGVNNETYQAVLLPETNTNGGQDTTWTAQDPLTSGTVTVANSTAKFTLKGAEPSSTYTMVESETTYIHSSGSYGIGNFNTDASGNGTGSASLSQGSGGDMLEAGRNANSAGFIGGFTVPK